MMSKLPQLQKNSGDELDKALSTFVNAVISGEITDMKRAIHIQEHELIRELDLLKQGNQENLEHMRRELGSLSKKMASRYDDLTSLVRKDKDQVAMALRESENKSLTLISTLKEKIAIDNGNFKNELDKLGGNIESKLNAALDKTTQKIAELDRILSEHESRLKEYKNEIDQVTELLSKIAKVFDRGFSSPLQAESGMQGQGIKVAKKEENIDPAIAIWLDRRADKLKNL